MGPGSSAVYELKEEECQQISKKLQGIFQPLIKSMGDTIQFYVMKKQVLLDKRKDVPKQMMPGGKISIDPPEYAGWVEKEGGSVKTWKRRWMVLSPGLEMAYYVEEADEQKGKKKGFFNLLGYSVVEGLLDGGLNSFIMKNKRIII